MVPPTIAAHDSLFITCTIGSAPKKACGTPTLDLLRVDFFPFICQIIPLSCVLWLG